MSTKTEIYERVRKEILAVIDGEPNSIARYATASCILSEAFEYFYWTGFYLIDWDTGDELVIGPYQGTLGCLRIPFGRGVCGTAVETCKTQIVKDVHEFPGHIACDSNSRSEIVVPVFDEFGHIAAVLDVDSTEIGSFDRDDREGLEAICKTLLVGVKS